MAKEPRPLAAHEAVKAALRGTSSKRSSGTGQVDETIYNVPRYCGCDGGTVGVDDEDCCK